VPESLQPPPKAKPKIIAVIPAFNEESYIGTVVLKTRQYVDEVIVVDDGSADQTAAVAVLAGATVIKHKSNKGYGASIQILLSQAKKRDPDILLLLDADSQHNPDEIPHLIEPISKGYDVVIGSREHQKANIPRYRHIGQRVIAYCSHALSGKKLYDSECGFRAFSRNAIAKLNLKETSMSISAETIADAAAKGLKITERPVSTIYTRDGSSLNPLMHGMGVLTRIFVMISERKPLFFFGLGGIVIIIFGLTAAIRVLNIFSQTGAIATGTAFISILLLFSGALSIVAGIILNVLKKRGD